MSTTTEAPAVPQWQSAAGPRQTKAVEDALRQIRTRGQKRIEIEGVHGGDSRRAEFWQPLSPPTPQSMEVYRELGEKFAWTITRENYQQIITEAELALVKVIVPESDNRITMEEHLENKRRVEARRAEEDAKVAALNAVKDAIKAKQPSWAEAVIIAELHENESDSMTDYFAHGTKRRVAIGWRRGKREDFKQLRAAAATFPETAHLGPGCEVYYLTAPDDDGNSRYIADNGMFAFGGNRAEFSTLAAAEAFRDSLKMITEGIEICHDEIEHRENYSMGSGNYLKAGHNHSTGWAVRSMSLGSVYGSLEDRLPDPKAAAPASGGEGPVIATSYRIEKHRHTKRGFDMWIVVVAEKSDRDVFEQRRDSCERAGGWYSRAWGRTPGGFAFKEQDAAATWAQQTLGNEPVVSDPLGVDRAYEDACAAQCGL